MNITKTTDALEVSGVSEQQLAAINRHTRRPLGADEVYVFSLVLCDNEVDRDFERFDDDALDTLAPLFVGKTGVFDHNPTAENQSARIFSTEVLGEEGRSNGLGQPYRCLKAWAYMLRCDKNRDLILEIDGGIKKEVSVGCAVARVCCSICGADRRGAGCEHRKGQIYGGDACHDVLCGPTDAYEWSFVAVPAQRGAGVTKGLYTTPGSGITTLEKLFSDSGDVTLTAAQVAGLRQEYQTLKAHAKAGEAHMDTLRREVIRLGLLCQKGMDPAILEEVVQHMDLRQLEAFRKAYATGAEQRLPTPQLAGPAPSPNGDAGMAAFRL